MSSHRPEVFGNGFAGSGRCVPDRPLLPACVGRVRPLGPISTGVAGVLRVDGGVAGGSLPAQGQLPLAALSATTLPFLPAPAALKAAPPRRFCRGGKIRGGVW